MTRKLKALGLALVAVFAMSAVAASGAQALEATLEAKEHGTLTGEQTTTHTFTLVKTGQELTCVKAHFHGKLALSNTHLLIQPTYESCHTVDPFGIKHGVTVTMNGCEYTFSKFLHDEIAKDYTASVTIVCPAGKAIEVHIYNGSGHTSGTLCTLTIAPQGPLTGNTITNSAAGVSPMDILIHHEIKVQVTNDGPSTLCGETGGKELEAIYKGTTTVKAFNTALGQVDLTAMTG